MNSYIVSYDVSNEGIPCLTVFNKNSSYTIFGENLKVIGVITGERAERIWSELTKQAKKEDN